MADYQTHDDGVRLQRIFEKAKECGDVINAVAENHIPTITESTFKKHVLEMLRKPYGPEFTIKWRKMFVDPSYDVAVVSDGANPKVLFRIPAILQSQNASIPDVVNGITLSHFTDHLSRFYELGQVSEAHALTQSFLKQVATTPDYGEVFFKPIHAILLRYGTDFILEDEDTPVVTAQEIADNANEPPAGDSFSSEYED